VGLQQQYLNFIEAALRRSHLYHGRMCELGNQEMRGNTGKQVRTGKEYFAPRFEHVSIDLNGRDGARPIDLAQPIADPDLVESFDVVTNIGTSEHVSDQFECFANIHRLAKLGGLIIHVSPIGDRWPNHERTYTAEFFARLIRRGPYRIDAFDEMTKGAAARVVVAVAATKTARAFLPRADFQALLSPDDLP
jgi:hypothetical protein